LQEVAFPENSLGVAQGAVTALLMLRGGSGSPRPGASPQFIVA